MQFHATLLAAILATVTAAQTLNIPTRAGSIISLSQPSSISGSVDFGNKEYDRGRACNSDADTGSSSAVFILANGASISNVIIDAISALGSGNVLIRGGGANGATDKVVQHNGKGTVTIENYTVTSCGKLYRSCGNCSGNAGVRKVVIKNLKAKGLTSDLIGINSNYGESPPPWDPPPGSQLIRTSGDTATISGSCGSIKKVCQEYTGIDKTKSSGSSTKLSSTAACLGAQGKLASLPAC
ncbi:Pectin lyase-like protein [Diplocarpon rosae]|nr:Pectin lyase-like protein [Diplocarpon rosae]